MCHRTTAGDDDVETLEFGYDVAHLLLDLRDEVARGGAASGLIRGLSFVD